MISESVIEEIFNDNSSLIYRYVDLLATDAVERGLIGPREADRLWERHVLNSVAIASLIPDDATMVDVGSGAGLPGIPLAIARPDISIVLVESMLRRTIFLNEVVVALDLAPRVRVMRARAEDVDGRFDVVTARAVAPLERLVRWTSHLFLPDGELLALKGSSAKEEIDAADAVLSAGGLTASLYPLRTPGTGEETFVVRVAGVSRET